jgi:nucleotide-binding universal stress UspA family protein
MQRGAPLIIVGFDGGSGSSRAAAYAIGIAARLRAHLLFLQVCEQSAGYGLLPQILPIDHDAIAVSQPGVRAEIAELIGDAAIEWELRQTIGSPLTELRRAAREVCADLVIVGSSTSYRRRLLRSVGGGLARTRQCPVIVVP